MMSGSEHVSVDKSIDLAPAKTDLSSGSDWFYEQPEREADRQHIFEPVASPYPFALYKTVLHTTDAIIQHYKAVIKRRHYRQIFTLSPISALKTLWWFGKTQIRDTQIEDYFARTLFGRFLRSPSGEEVAKFATTDFSGDLLMCDFKAMDYCQPDTGQYSSPSQALFCRNGNNLRLLGINVGDRSFSPVDGNAWSLAKNYLLHGAGYHVLSMTHPRVHFPMDTIIGHTLKILPENHIIRRLLRPHIEFTLEVNSSVMHSEQSILNPQNRLPFASLFAAKPNFLKLMSIGFAGDPCSSSYEPYRFSTEVGHIETDYQQFLDGYLQCFRTFTTEVLSSVSCPFGELERQWAKAIEQDLPGFSAAQCEAELDKVLARIMWSASVEHGVDHASWASVPVKHVCLRLRVPPPHKHCAYQPRKLRSLRDLFGHLLSWRMFFKPNNVRLLKDIDYRFKDDELRQLNADFRASLVATEQALKQRGIHIYEPLNNIATSIQY